jgi:hypothetical protein
MHDLAALPEQQDMAASLFASFECEQQDMAFFPSAIFLQQAG